MHPVLSHLKKGKETVVRKEKARTQALGLQILLLMEVLFLLTAVLNIPANAQEEAKELRILTDGKELREIHPIRIKEKLYLPLEPIAKALGIAITIGDKAVVTNGRNIPATVILFQNLHFVPRDTIQNALGVRAYVMRDECIVYVMSPWYEYNYFTKNTGQSGTQQKSSSSGGSPGGKSAGNQNSVKKLEIVNHRIYGEFSQNQNILVDVTVQNNTAEPQRNVTILFQIVGVRDRSNYEKKTVNYFGKVDESIPPGSRRNGTVRLSLRNLAEYKPSGNNSGQMVINLIGQDYQQTHEYQISIEGQ